VWESNCSLGARAIAINEDKTIHGVMEPAPIGGQIGVLDDISLK
jgi:hypothetical protein